MRAMLDESTDDPLPLSSAELPSGDAGDLDAVRGRLMRLAYKWVWNRADAEDLAQDALRLAVAAGVSQREARFVPWLLRTVGNLCLNHVRRRRPERLTIAELHSAAASSGDPARRLSEVERLDRLRAAIERLPPQQRLAIVLRGLEQRRFEEVADIMDLSVSAVRTHVHLARQRLLAELGEST